VAVVATNNVVTSNWAAACPAACGSAILASGVNTSLTSSGNAYSNHTGVNGSAVCLSGGASGSVSGDTFTRNTATSFGGGIYADASSQLSVSANTSFAQNTAVVGACAFIASVAQSPPVVSSASNNGASNYGSGGASPPAAFTLSLGGVALAAAPGGVYNLSSSSSTALGLSVALQDAYGSAVSFWQDFTADITCPGCPAGALLGATHSVYFSSASTFGSLAVAGAPGSVFPLQLLLASPTIPLFVGGLRVNMTVTVTPCPPLQTFDPTSRRCQCGAGSFLNGASGTCSACPVGTYTPLAGATGCLPCPINSYQTAAGASTCVPCPDARASSPPGSSTLLNCSCSYGTFALYDSAITTFTCAPCPVGALCSGPLSPSGPTAPPVALEGYWHAPNDTTAFYDCRGDMCPPEQVGEYPNCRKGHTGLVCAECIPGWRVVDGFCESCDGQESVASWPAARREALAFFLALIALVIGAAVLWWPLIGETIIQRVQALRGKKGVSHEEAAVQQQRRGDKPGYFALALAMIAFFGEPLALVVENGSLEHPASLVASLPSAARAHRSPPAVRAPGREWKHPTPNRDAIRS
jgi:predicted outer membrane repeat protein